MNASPCRPQSIDDVTPQPPKVYLVDHITGRGIDYDEIHRQVEASITGGLSMPLWAKYDRANGRIVAITEADQAPPEDKLVAVIEAGPNVKVGDFIGGANTQSADPEPDNTLPEDLTPDAPQVGKPQPKDK